jgi:hypothetical protein
LHGFMKLMANAISDTEILLDTYMVSVSFRNGFLLTLLASKSEVVHIWKESSH